MIFVHLTDKEEELLLEHRRKSQTELIRMRSHAILLSGKGFDVVEIANILDVTENTVRRCLKSFEQTRISSVFPTYIGNSNASKLTDKQLEEIKKTLSKPPKNKDGLPSHFWSVKSLKSYITAEYGIVYESDRSYHHIFAISGYSFKLPEGFDQRRNNVTVLERMAEIQTEMKTREKQGYVILAADECSLAWETEYRRAWLKQGQKTILKVSRDKTRQNYFGALNLKTGKEELIELSWQNTETMIEALRELTRRYKSQKLAVIWDNAKWHRSKELRSLLGKNKEFNHVRFIWLPPYAPDHNPQEHVWKVAKEATANTVTRTFEELKSIFKKSITNKLFDYKM